MRETILKTLVEHDRLSATQWNEVVRLLQQAFRTDDCITFSDGVYRRKRVPAQYEQAAVFNGTGGVVNIAGILAANAYTNSTSSSAGSSATHTPPDDLSGFLDLPVRIAGSVPKMSDDFGAFLVIPDGLDVNGYGKGIVSGLCAVQIKVDQNHEWYGYADIADGHTDYLQTYPKGAAEIIWQPLDENKIPKVGTWWAVVNLGSYAPIIQPFECKTALAAGGNCEAWPLWWNEDVGTYGSARARNNRWVETLYDDITESTNGFARVTGTYGGPSIPGTILWAQWFADPQRWEIMANPDTIIRCRLTSDFPSCGTATAIRLTLDSDANTKDGEPINLRDPLGVVSGMLTAVKHVKPKATPGVFVQVFQGGEFPAL